MSGAGSTANLHTAACIRWWDREYAGDKARADACFRWLSRIMSRQTIRRRMHLVNMRMYEDLPSIGLGPYTFTVYDPGDDTLRLNLVRAVIDTWVPLVGRSKPKPQALTSDGDWTLKKRAKGLSRWLEGKFDEAEIYRNVSIPCLRHAAVFGMGAAIVYRAYPEYDDITDVDVEPVFPWEVLADEVEAQNPKRLRTMARRKLIDRQQAADMFPSAKEYILRQAPRYAPGSLTYDFAVETTSDMIVVAEFWRLPSRPGAKDGLHVIACPGKTLFQARWDRMRFPIKLLYRTRPTQGIWGVSIPTELRGLQVHINTTLLDIEECLRLYGKPKWMYQVGSVDPNFLDDEVDSAIPFHGQVPPTVYSPSVMPAEVYAQLWQFWAKGFEQIGVAAARSQGEVPEGLSGSGASIRAWNDVEDGRTFEAGSNFEDWHMQIAEEMIEEARGVAEVRPDYSTALRGKTSVQIVNFKDVDPGEDRYYLQVFPISRLSTAPAQRLAQLQELFNSQLIDQEQFRELLDFPDLEAESNLLNAPRELAERLISKFLEADDPDEPGVFEYPEAEWPLAQLKVRFQYAEVRARLDGAPEGNCRLLRQFIQLCDQMAAKAQPPAPPPQQMPAGPPQAPPGAAPQQPPALPPGQPPPAMPQAA